MIRAYRATDEPQIATLLAAAWPEDPVMVEISALHGPDVDGDDRRRRTLVAEVDRDLVGVATVLASPRHLTFSFFTAVVAPARRRRGIGLALLDELRQGWDERPLLARVRDTDEAGIAFLLANRFSLRMRSRSVTVDPGTADVVTWIENQQPLALERPAGREEVARAHEQAYRRVHADWAPTTDRPLEESLHVFCGEGWLPESAVLARDGDEIVGVGSLYSAPSVFAGDGLFMIADTILADGRVLRSLVAAQLEWARRRGVRISFEADEANVELWQLIHEIPARVDPQLLLLSTEALEPA
jgi:GNAT superfamily N-acetyltransferase